MQGSKDEKHSCPAHDFYPHGSGSHKTTAISDEVQKKKKKKTEREISPVLDGAEAFFWNHVCKSKIDPSEKSVPVVLRWFEYSLSVSGPCSSAGSVCFWQRCDTLFIPGLRGGRHRNYPSFAIGSKEIQRLFVMWTGALFVWLHRDDGFTRHEGMYALSSWLGDLCDITVHKNTWLQGDLSVKKN